MKQTSKRRRDLLSGPAGYDGAMALIFRGKSACSICGRILMDGDEIRGFPAFIADRSDPLWKYSDSAVHASCYEKWEHRTEFELKYTEAVERFSKMRIEEI
jgi:hypothetical protein